MFSTEPTRSNASVGTLLQRWRKARSLSQLDLAGQAEISPRHLSFLETGRSKPSREMVLLLANALDVPLRERNALLLAAGFAPIFDEHPLDAPAVASVRTALDAILRQQEPFPCVVMDRYWGIVQTNTAAARFFSHMLEGAAPREPMNVAHLMFDPRGLRPRIRNWNAVAVALLGRVRREALGGVLDAKTRKLVEDLVAYAGAQPAFRDVDIDRPSIPIIPVSFSKGEGEPVFDFFSTVTTLGTPQDVTLQELRIECFFPVDAKTERNARALTAALPGS